MEDWAAHKRLNEAQKLANYKTLSEREALDRQLQQEKEAQRYAQGFRSWVRKQEQLAEKEKLL
jgi:hypothetical protein